MNLRKATSAAALFALAALSAGAAPFPAKLVLAQEPGQTVNVQIRWMPADKRYMAAFQGGGERPVALEDVLSLDVQPPANWKQLVDQARKTPDAAIPGLTRIMEEYRMLGWDAEAGRVIATIQLRKGRAKEAVETCRKVVNGNPDAAWNSVLAPVYWQALLDTNNTGALAALLDKGATASNRGVAAQACLRRGDLLMTQGLPQKALTDGFLRVVFLYADQAGAQAEALYRAAEAFDKASRPVYAEKMRTMLLSKHRGTQWAAKLGGK